MRCSVGSWPPLRSPPTADAQPPPCCGTRAGLGDHGAAAVHDRLELAADVPLVHGRAEDPGVRAQHLLGYSSSMSSLKVHPCFLRMQCVAVHAEPDGLACALKYSISTPCRSLRVPQRLVDGVVCGLQAGAPRYAQQRDPSLAHPSPPTPADGLPLAWARAGAPRRSSRPRPRPRPVPTAVRPAARTRRGIAHSAALFLIPEM